MAVTNETVIKSLGPVSAYAIAVAEGFQGTRAEWESYIANASIKAREASLNALVAEGYANGQQNGVAVVDPQSPYFENNSKYYMEQTVSIKTTAVQVIQEKGEEVLQSIPSDYTELSGNVEDLKSALNNKADIIIYSVSGAVASFPDGADDLPVKDLTVEIEPAQDLHGYDHPWPAGGGKNKAYRMDSGLPMTINGITVSADGTDGVKVTGTASATIGFNVFEFPVESGKTYTVSFGMTTITGVYVNLPKYSNGTNIGNVGGISKNAPSFTFAADGTFDHVRGRVTVDGGVNANGIVIMIQAEEGSTATAWTPYSNICPITGWTGAKVTRTGKNLLNIAEAEMVSVGYNRCFPLRLKAGTYTMSCQNRLAISGAGSSCQVSIVNSNRGRIKIISLNYAYSNSYKSFSFTITDNEANQMAYLAFDPIANGATFSDIESMQNMLELGSTAIAYEPHQGETYNITFPSEAGTVYGGTLDVTTGVLTVDRATVDLGALTDNGDTGWKYITNDGTPYFRVYLTGKRFGLNMICSVYGTNQTTGTGSLADKKIGASANDTRIYLRDSAYTDLNTFISAMSGVQLVYELATPITYQLTPQEVRTLLGDNNIWADTGDVNVSYRADTKLYIDGKIAEAIANALNA